MNEIRRFVLPAAALRVLGQTLDITVDHAPLELPVPADASADAAYRDLAQAGLYTDSGLLPDVERALRLLADPEVAVSVLAELDEGRWTARAAFDGRGAILAEQVGGDVTVTRLPVPGWEPSLAALLPRLRPAPGEPVTTVVTEAGQEVDEQASGIAHLPSSAGPTTVADVAEVLAAPRRGSGRFVITARATGTHPATPPLSWVDTQLGTYAITASTESDHTRTAYVPVDNAGLGTLLEERVADVHPVGV